MIEKKLKDTYKAATITIIILLIIIGGVNLSLSILKNEAIDTNLKIADFHANSLSEQIKQTFISLDITIKEIDNSIVKKEDLNLLKNKFKNIIASNAYIRSISLLDKDHKIISSSNEKNIGVEITDSNFHPKPMFNNKILRFGNPWIGRDFEDGKDIITLISIDKKSASFLPIIRKITVNDEVFFIAININSDYFINKYSTNLENNFATLELIRIDGMLLFSSNKNRQVGALIENSALIEEAIQKSKSLGIETINNKQYLTSYRLIETFPLNVAIGLDFEKTMTKWEEKRITIILIVTLLVLFLIALVFILIYRYSKEKQHELEFQKSTQRILEKAKELAEKANIEKSDFLANMSHEIRTPLNGIMGLTDLVLRSALDEKQRDYLQKAQKSSHILLSLINDILDYSKIEAGKLNLEHRAFNLDEVIGSVIDLFEHEASNRNLLLEIDTPPNLNLVGDSLRLRQVLTNIVGNAIKFTKKGFVKVTISIKNEDKNSINLDFSIKDSGIGMCQEVQESLFKKFTQADSSITREYGGTGLGLSISKQLVELMGGKISLESSLGVGSDFMFSIKFTKQETLTAEKTKQPIKEKNKFKSCIILLVEDNSINQLVVVGILENLGINVDIANNGKEAVDKAKIKNYDLILMDIQMPIMDGFEATKKIRNFNKDIPIIALSAAVLIEDKEKTKQAGMNAHLEKPIDQQKLSNIISQYLDIGNISPKLENLKKESLKNESLVSKDCFYGVDIQDLKGRVGDNPEIIKQLLLSFCDDYQFPEEKFDISIIETDNFDKAIHALKGISGNISLTDIFELSKKIHESNSSDKKTELTLKLIELLKKTREKLIIELNSNSYRSEASVHYKINDEAQFLKEFMDNLDNFIAMTPEQVNIFLQLLKKHTAPEELLSIKNDLNNYKYEEAGYKIKKIKLH